MARFHGDVVLLDRREDPRGELQRRNRTHAIDSTRSSIDSYIGIRKRQARQNIFTVDTMHEDR